MPKKAEQVPKKAGRGSSSKDNAHSKRAAAIRALLLRPHTPQELAKMQVKVGTDFGISGYEHHDRDYEGRHDHMHKIVME